MKGNLEYSENLIKKAENLVSQAQNEFREYLPSYSNVIFLCQSAIELSGKAIFKTMGFDFPKEHQLLFERKGGKVKPIVKELLQRQFPEYFVYKEEIPRIIFLTYFWFNFHILAKYGIEDIPPDKIFTKEEADLALKHAENCVKVAYDLLIQKRAEARG